MCQYIGAIYFNGAAFNDVWFVAMSFPGREFQCDVQLDLCCRSCFIGHYQ